MSQTSFALRAAEDDEGLRNGRSVACIFIAFLMTGCHGDCAGVGLARLGVTERTIAVGDSFTATYELGGSCSNTFEPVADPTSIGLRWASAETTVVAVDSLTGRVTGKRVGDALVVPSQSVTTGPLTLLVHVR